ncbi:hypothetical protein FO519_009616 [Halicephalobus sp. NKZ332]|nr:hypothetical protein FO519_009616 [Halicephalobus sp. NKZ332]
MSRLILGSGSLCLNFDFKVQKPPGWTPEDDIQAAHYLMGEDAFKNPDCINNEKSYTNITLRGYLRFCETRNPRSTKKLSALILGNSHANSAGPIIHRNKVFDKVITVSGASCPFPAKGGRGFCPDVMNIGIEVLEQLKPDVTFLLFAYLDRMLWRSSRPVEEDPKFHILNRTITEFSKYTKAIIINELDVRFSYGATKVFLRRKKMGPNIKSLRQKRNLSGERAIRRCLHLLLKYCPICVLVRPHDAFCDDRYCDPIDKEYNLPMFIDHGHIQALGRLRYKPFIDKAISQAIDIINKNPRKNKN